MPQQLMVSRELCPFDVRLAQFHHLFLLLSAPHPLGQIKEGIGLNPALFKSDTKEAIEETQACLDR